jgi:rhamnulokinase
MSTARHVAAIDLGAESGRVAKVSFDGERLSLDVAHRFSHAPRLVDEILRWDFDQLRTGVLTGLEALAAGGDPISSVGTDTWGVDYGLLDPTGTLVDEPTCYRDPRQSRARARILEEFGPSRIYDATGVQIIDINTIFALASDATEHPDRLKRADRLVMLPDIFHHLLSGSTVTEYTAASTSGCYDLAAGRWATELLDDLGIPTHMLPEVVPPGTDVGPMLGEYAVGSLSDARVVLPPGHDTASAVVGAPLSSTDGLYISSGTWSLAGIEIPLPIVSDRTRVANITNEGGYGGMTRFLRNVAGLWVIQSCKRAWAAEGTELSYPELVALAGQAEGLRSIVNPDAPEFLDGQDTPARIQEYCRWSKQPVPLTVGEIARCVFDSLALSYRHVVSDLREITGFAIPTVNIVGGGSNTALLSQLTADAVGTPVVCGPVEATALGNAAVQLVTLGELEGLSDIRRVIKASAAPITYLPRPHERWEAAYDTFTNLVTTDRSRQGLGV